MFDSLLRRNNPEGDSGRVQTPAEQLREALSPTSQSSEPAKPQAVVIEISKHDTPERLKPAAPRDSIASMLIVGPDIKLRGSEITDCDTLIVEGRVEATMDSRVIRIDEKGTFVGKVGIDFAEIRGRFEGELVAREQLVIRSTGRLSGKIRYGKLMVEEGGEVSGDIAAIAAG